MTARTLLVSSLLILVGCVVLFVGPGEMCSSQTSIAFCTRGYDLCPARVRVCSGPTVTELALLVSLQAEGLSEALQDAVAGAIGEAVIPLASVKDLLVGAGVGLAAAKRIVGRLVRCVVQCWLCCHTPLARDDGTSQAALLVAL